MPRADSCLERLSILLQSHDEKNSMKRSNKIHVDLDKWYEELDAMCRAGDPEDDKRLRQALSEAHEKAKDLVRESFGRNDFDN